MSYNIVPRMDRARGWSPARFASLRVASGKTWAVLSDETGVPMSTLHSWSTTNAPPAKALKKIAKALNCTQTALCKNAKTA